MVESSLQVRSRLAQSLTWKDLSGGAEVMDEQYIFTGDQARAKIQLGKGPLIDISEKTLIRLHDPEKKSLIVEQGIIRATVSSATPLEVEVNGKKISISGENADVVMNIQNGNSEIGITSGKAELKVDSQTQIMTSKELVSIGSAPGSEISVTTKIDLVSPVENAVYHQAAREKMVDFSWIAQGKAKLEISHNQDFSKSIVTVETENKFTQKLKAGHYYWRVKQNTAKSQVGEFSIKQEMAPQIIGPKNGEIIRIIDYSTEESILLQWDKTEGPFEIEIQSAKGEQRFEKIYPPFEFKVTETQDLNWRVRRFIDNRPEAIWSDWQKIKVDYAPRPRRPENLKPVDYEQITYGDSPKIIPLSWDGDFSSYEIEVKSGQYLETIQANSNQYQYVLKNPGQYDWRVRVKDEFGREAEFSEWQKFSWIDESASVNKNAVKIILKKPSQKVSFTWEDPRGGQVIFELAKDQQFTDIVMTKNLQSESTEVTFPDQGTYYWRTQKVSAQGEKVLSAPKKVIIEPAPAPEKPESLPEVEVPLEFIETTYRPSFWDFFISSAYADEIKLAAPLNWPAKEEAEFYQIEIYSDEEGTQKVHEFKTKQNSYRWENPKIGEYYWRFAVIDYWGRVSPFSDLSLLKVIPPQNFELNKAKLLAPIRKQELLLNDEISFSWTPVKEAENYIFELSGDDDFDDILKTETTKKTALTISGALDLGDYYWRVKTQKWNQTKESSTGRFVVKAPAPLVSTPSPQKERVFKLADSLLIISWAPSMDALNFESKKAEGDISGNVLVGLKLDYHKQLNPIWRFEGSLLHQSGEVFEKEAYKFRHTKLGASRKITEKLSVSPSVGLVEYQGYAQSTGKLKASDQRAFDIGAELRYQLTYSESRWDISGEFRALGVLSYGLGVRRFSGKWTQGMFFQNRIYDDSSFEGTQSSLRLEIGRLFSFD